MTNPNDVEFDVVIIGYGPVGACAAIMLAQRGWRVAIVDRMPGIYPLPRAVNFDGEIMRLFQEIGLADEMAAQTEPILGAEFVDAGRKRVQGFDVPEGATGAHGWPDGNFFHQPSFERTLRDKVESFANVSVFIEHEAGVPDQHTNGVTVDIRPVSGGEEKRLNASYLLAADGAASPIRKALAIDFKSLGYDCDWLVVDILLKDEVTLPAIPQQVCDPERLATFVPITGKRRRWEFRRNDNETREELLQNEKILELISPWMDPAKAEIERAAVYQFHAATADRWREGQIFLLGDAAHQTPPFLGQGMCAGLRDVANLMWKLDYVKNAMAPDTILDTYQQERDPHALDLVDHAVALGRLMEEIAEAQVTGKWPDNMDAIYGGSRGFPRLHEGVLAEGTEEDSGRAFGFVMPQPKVRDGESVKRLDDIIGPRFAIIAEEDISGEISADNKSFLDRLGAKMIAVPQERRQTNELDLLLAMNRAVILRPDKYVFGTVNEQRDLNEQLRQLQTHF